MANGQAATTYRAKIRMYRHGLGDCFLVTLPRRGPSSTFTILIDCGVIQGTPDAKTKMERVFQDILDTTGGKVDLLVVTHEHADHLSGFLQANESFKKLSVDQVWMGWTEDPDDPKARELADRRGQALKALQASRQQLQLGGNAAAAWELGNVLDFFGVAGGGGTTHDALEAVRAKVDSPRYCRPDDPPASFDGVDARLYVLGPPTDPAMIRKTLPSKTHPETYEVVGNGDDRLGFLMDTLKPCLDGDQDAPFGPMWQIPFALARDIPFFKTHYWGERAESWRTIDTAWLEGATNLALQLDSLTNNTSLVIAIELGNGDVLLFAADAQVGSWLSWQSLEWKDGDQVVTGPELLRRTKVYKVGHHGSHNATLREKGLESMGPLDVALLPVDKIMAEKKRWSRMPLPSLVERLKERSGERLLQADQPRPATLAAVVEESELYFEYRLN